MTRLEESWDEVHLDHDLGAEQFVDSDRDDCGMAVIRWLESAPRPHLKTARFRVHSRNANAACMMVLRLEALGFHVEAAPFSSSRQRSSVLGSRWNATKDRIRQLLSLSPRN